MPAVHLLPESGRDARGVQAAPAIGNVASTQPHERRIVSARPHRPRRPASCTDDSPHNAAGRANGTNGSAWGADDDLGDGSRTDGASTAAGWGRSIGKAAGLFPGAGMAAARVAASRRRAPACGRGPPTRVGRAPGWIDSGPTPRSVPPASLADRGWSLARGARDDRPALRAARGSRRVRRQRRRMDLPGASRMPLPPGRRGPVPALAGIGAPHRLARPVDKTPVVRALGASRRA